jgi:precorrin-6B C5,15-methyltransferase / cobalt-precorrin-6B C5,C15-methyltransferase
VDSGRRRIAVVGVMGDELTKAARRAIEGADVVVGGHRLLAAHAPAATRTIVIEPNVDATIDAVAAADGGVCVLASGDPGFFGIVRALGARFGREALDVHPVPSSVALAFARLGLSWDDAVVVSAHGRPLEAAARAAAPLPKVAVLTSPESPPERLGMALLGLGCADRRVFVCSDLATADERVTEVNLHQLAAGSWSPLSVVVLVEDRPRHRGEKTLAWGLPDDAFAHRAGMITKSEVRAVVLARLALPSRGVLWDVGAGSGSVAIECASVAPELRVIAVDRDPAATELVAANAHAHAARVDVVLGDAPGILENLPDPDRVFIGGGGLDVLDASLARLRPGGRVVATFAAIGRAAAAAARLGNVVQVAVSRGEPLPDGGMRLAAENPVFVTWGYT